MSWVVGCICYVLGVQVVCLEMCSDECYGKVVEVSIQVSEEVSEEMLSGVIRYMVDGRNTYICVFFSLYDRVHARARVCMCVCVCCLLYTSDAADDC